MLIDDIKRNPGILNSKQKSIFHGIPNKEFLELVHEAVVIESTNVAQMVFEDKRSETGWDMINDFPNIAPPAPLTWIEMRPPDCLLTDLAPHMTALQRHIKRWGMFVLTLDRQDPNHMRFIDMAGFLQEIAQDFKNAQPWRWILLFHLVIDYREFGPRPAFEWYIPVAANGEHADFGLPLNHGSYAKVHSLEFTKDEEIYKHEHLMTPMLAPTLMTIALLHCKNVVRHVAEPPHKLAKKAEKRYGFPPVKHWTLDIRPMREVLKHEGKSESLGLHKAMHICRGHFRTYDEKPLFGKVKGTFWVPMHLKGNAEYGLVDKTYNVEV